MGCPAGEFAALSSSSEPDREIRVLALDGRWEGFSGRRIASAFCRALRNLAGGVGW